MELDHGPAEPGGEVVVGAEGSTFMPLMDRDDTGAEGLVEDHGLDHFDADAEGRGLYFGTAGDV